MNTLDFHKKKVNDNTNIIPLLKNAILIAEHEGSDEARKFILASLQQHGSSK